MNVVVKVWGALAVNVDVSVGVGGGVTVNKIEIDLLFVNEKVPLRESVGGNELLGVGFNVPERELLRVDITEDVKENVLDAD